VICEFCYNLHGVGGPMECSSWVEIVCPVYMH